MVATDLDGTVIFSVHPPPCETVTVDPVADACMSRSAAETWDHLSRTAIVAPVTTRSVEQYRRLLMPGRQPGYALVCNGALLLVDGEPDEDWSRTVRRRLARSATTFTAAWEQAVRWREAFEFTAVRPVGEYFIYLTAARRERWLPEAASAASAWAAPNGWHASLQGRKLYLVPAELDKSVAVAQLAERLGVDEVFAGGDSQLDAGMLSAASAAILPNQGELHRSGFADPRCVVTAGSGLAAGDEIVAWYGDRSSAGMAPGRSAGPAPEHGAGPADSHGGEFGWLRS